MPAIVRNECNDTIIPVLESAIRNEEGCRGSIIYTWNYTDCAGHTHPWSAVILIEDTTRPSFTTPSNIHICKMLMVHTTSRQM